MGEFIAVCLYAAYMGLGLGVLFYVDNRWWKSVENLVGKSIVAVVVDWHLWPLTALFACLNHYARARTRRQATRRSAGDIKNISPISLQGYRRPM